MAKDEIVDMQAAEGPTTDPLITGLVIFTTIALALGFYIIEKALADNYGIGMLAK
jgi:hypothetical protein